MGKYRFADPGVQRIALSEGDWVEIRKELSIADELKFGRARNEGDFVGLLAAMVLDWSFTDADDKKMPCGEDTMQHLLPDDANEIVEAIAKYLSADKEEKKARKSQATSKSEKRLKSSAG